MNGLSIFQIKVSNKYTSEDFDEDLRTVLRRAGCKGEKICFILDESSQSIAPLARLIVYRTHHRPLASYALLDVLDAGFLERMNTLLANAEVPGLFEAVRTPCLLKRTRSSS